MYRKMYNGKINSVPKCATLDIEPEVKAKPIVSNRAKRCASIHTDTKRVSKKEEIEGESDETARKTYQQVNRLTERQRAANCMYRKMYNGKINSVPKCATLDIEPEVKAKPIVSNRAKRCASIHTDTKRVSKKEEIEGESDETARKTYQQVNRLTERQRAVLIQTFAELERDPVRNALKMLVKLFSEHPQYKLIWPQFRQIPDSSLMNAVALR
ncbi:hypothetical protein COOONC_05146 [Cooperia oncophora]